MPKATRRKKLKAEDFRKTKLKVGKKVQPAQNQTDVSFKSQSIVVPNQSLGEVKPASELVNNRNQSLKDLIVQLRHYSSQSRKDALSGIRDIQIKYADTFKTQLSIIMEATAPILVDEDRQVRKSLLAFFKDFIPTVTRDNIRPFLSTILAYTCSAMTHISEDIRLDGLKFLTIWQDYYPTLVAMHAEKVIPNYLSMLSTNGKSQSIAGSGTGSSLLVNPQSQLGSAKARVEVLESLLGFLKLVMRKGTNAWWFFPGKEVQQGIAHATKSECISEWPGNRQTGVVAHGCSQLLRNHHRENLHNGGRFELFGASATSSIQSERVTIGSTGLGNKPAQAIRNTYQLADFYQLQAFIDVLMPTLVDLWLESSPNAFTPGSIAFTPALSVMHTVLKMMNLMWRSILVEFKAQQVKTNWVAGWLKVISKHFMTHFPFGKGNFSVRDKQVDVVLQDMNILFCELLSHFSLNATSTAAESSSRWKEIMLEYMMELFDENPSSKKQDKTVALLNSEQLEATFPIVWSLLNVLNDEDSGNFLRAFVNKGNTMWGTPSAIAMFQFMSRLLKFTNHQTSERSFTSSPQCIDVLRQWVLMLPKRLWQLKGSNPVFSKNILEVLTYLLKNNPCQFASEKAVTNGLESSIIPFFHVETAKGPVFGPFIASPEPVQLAAVTLLYYLLNWPEKLIRGFAECMTNLVVPSTVTCYALGMLDHRQHHAAQPLPLDIFCSILLTVGAVGWTAADIAAIKQQMSDSNGVTTEIIGTEDFLKFRVKQYGQIAAAEYWIRREQIVLQFVISLSHQPEIAALVLPRLHQLLRAGTLPLDSFYGIARAILTVSGNAGIPIQSFSDLLADLPAPLVASVRSCYGCAANTEYRKASEYVLETALALLAQHPELRQVSLKVVLAYMASTSDSAKPLAHTDHEVLSTLKVATRLILGTEQLRNMVTADQRCLQTLRAIVSNVQSYMAHPANAALGNQLLIEETDMLSRFLA